MTEQKNNQVPKAQDNPFYSMAMEECDSEISIIRHMFSKAAKAEDTEAACKAAETIARIKQSAMMNATRMNVLIAEANMRARQMAQPQAAQDPAAKLSVVKDET